MSTDLGKLNDKYLTRFYGGDKAGVCLQITPELGDGYVHLTAGEMVALLPIFKDIIEIELSKKKAECEQVILENKEMKKTIVNDMRLVADMAISQPVFDMASLLNLGGDKIDKSEAEE